MSYYQIKSTSLETIKQYHSVLLQKSTNLIVSVTFKYAKKKTEIWENVTKTGS